MLSRSVLSPVQYERFSFVKSLSRRHDHLHIFASRKHGQYTAILHTRLTIFAYRTPLAHVDILVSPDPRLLV